MQLETQYNIAIKKLQALGRLQPMQFRAEVPEGRYGLRVELGGGCEVVVLFMVEHGRRGSKWEGYIFLQMVTQDGLQPIRCSVDGHMNTMYIFVLQSLNDNLADSQRLFPPPGRYYVEKEGGGRRERWWRCPPPGGCWC